MFIISETEKELALSALALELSVLPSDANPQSVPSQAQMKLRAGVEPEVLFPSGVRQVWNQHLESSQMETWSTLLKCPISNHLIG